MDLILIGDLFYERDLAARVTAFLDRCLATGISALIGDPGRAFLPHSQLRRLWEFPASDFGDGKDPAGNISAVFSFGAAR